MVRTLTARFVEAVIPDNGRTEYRDDRVTGLMLRVSIGGAKTWSVQFVRKSDGRKRRLTIGTYPAFSLDDACIEARNSRGEDPASVHKPRAEYFTFSKLAGSWLELYARPSKVASAVYENTLLLNKDIRPAIGAMKVEDVTKRDVIRLAVGAGPITGHAATRAMSRARAGFTVADFRVHDLRRTCAYGMARLGVNPHTIALVLDHISTTKANVTSSVYVVSGFGAVCGCAQNGRMIPS